MTKRNYFFNPMKLSLILASLIGLAFLFQSFSGGPPSGKTGAPSESTCTDCHAPGNSTYEGVVQLAWLPDTVYVGQAYAISFKTISTGNDTPVKAGFEMTEIGANGATTGSFANLDPTTGTDTQPGLQRQYIRQNSTKFFANSDTVSWVFQWTAPQTTGAVTFYASALLANDNLENSGDKLIPFSKQVIVAMPPTLNFDVTIDNITEPFCYGYSNGIAHASVTDPTFPLTYLWSTGDTTSWVYNIPAGPISVTVTDGAGNVDSAYATIGQPDSLNAIILAPSTMLSCLDSILLTAGIQGGTPPYTLKWGENLTQTDSFWVSEPGFYCVNITDANQCATSACISITADTNTVFCYGITYDTISCTNSTGQLYANAGANAGGPITYSWTGPNGFVSYDKNPVYTDPGTYMFVAASANSDCYCISTIDVQTFTEFDFVISNVYDAPCHGGVGQVEGDIVAGAIEPITAEPNLSPDSIPPGDYEVILTNGVGCKDTISFSIGEPDPISVDIQNVNPATGSIDITTSGGTSPYSWTWYNSDSIAVSNDEDPTGLPAGTYFVEVTDDHGCQFTSELIIISGTEDVELDRSIQITPNPASTEVTLSQNGNHILHVEVYNMQRQLIQRLTFAGRQHTLDIRDLPKGIYQIIFKSDDRFAVKQLIVE